jgi:hypothetical protein
LHIGGNVEKSAIVNAKYNSDRARRIEYIDSQSGRRLVFLTNNFKLKAETIARIYR